MAKKRVHDVQMFEGEITRIHRSREGIYFLNLEYENDVIECYTLPEDAISDLKERLIVKDYHDIKGAKIKVYEFKGNFASFDLA